jgi:hypothetical protein
VAVAVWAAVIVWRTIADGFAFNRELLLLYICTGLIAASIGQGRRVLYVVRDWFPFAIVLIAYDLSRGAASVVGRPTLWHWQADLDRWMFFGVMPTVWLQERLKLPHPPWWEVVISSVYMSFFILPYVIAGVLWLRNRDEWKAFVRLFVTLSFTALVIYALVPAEPAVGQRPHRPGAGQRQPGRGDPVAARRVVGGDRGVPVEPGAAALAAAAGGVSADDGVHAGLHRRALRHRYPAGLGARRGGPRRPGPLGRDAGRAPEPPRRDAGRAATRS